MRVRPIFAWYDLWVGVFVDRPKRRVFVFPVPCIGVVIERQPPHAAAGSRLVHTITDECPQCDLPQGHDGECVTW